MDLDDRLGFHHVPARWYLAHLHRQLRRLEPEPDLLPLLAARNRVALDVGANKGVYTQVLLRLATAVHAFEPNPALIAARTDAAP